MAVPRTANLWRAPVGPLLRGKCSITSSLGTSDRAGLTNLSDAPRGALGLNHRHWSTDHGPSSFYISTRDNVAVLTTDNQSSGRLIRCLGGRYFGRQSCEDGEKLLRSEDASVTDGEREGITKEDVSECVGTEAISEADNASLIEKDGDDELDSHFSDIHSGTISMLEKDNEFTSDKSEPFIYNSSPHNLTDAEVRNVVSDLYRHGGFLSTEPHHDEESEHAAEPGIGGGCIRSKAESETGGNEDKPKGGRILIESPWNTPRMSYPEPNGIWPNPLLHNHRMKPFSVPENVFSEAQSEEAGPAEGEEKDDAKLRALLDSNYKRTVSLWRLSNSHGVSWDAMERCYQFFLDMKSEKEARWMENRQRILHYAYHRQLKKLIKYRTAYLLKNNVDIHNMPDGPNKTALLQPRSIHRAWIRRLYKRWHYNYMRPFERGRLSEFLKGEVTSRMLIRETNERSLSFRKENGSTERYITNLGNSAHKDDRNSPPFYPLSTFASYRLGGGREDGYLDLRGENEAPTDDLAQPHSEDADGNTDQHPGNQSSSSDSLVDTENLIVDNRSSQQKNVDEFIQGFFPAQANANQPPPVYSKQDRRYNTKERLYLKRKLLYPAGDLRLCLERNEWFDRWDMEGVGTRMLEAADRKASPAAKNAE